MSMGEIAVRNCSAHGRYTFDMFSGKDICPECNNERMNKSMKNELQKAIEQIGYEAVRKAIPVGAKMGNCDLHGMYMMAPDATALCCPSCPNLPDPNGVTATDVEHYINIKDALDPSSGDNPGQVINPVGR